MYDKYLITSENFIGWFFACETVRTFRRCFII